MPAGPAKAIREAQCDAALAIVGSDACDEWESHDAKMQPL